MPEGRPQLRALARRLGIEDGYRSALDQGWVETTDATREALAAAMGFPADGEAAAARALETLAAPPAETADADLAGAPPERCVDVGDKLSGRRGFGLWCNLYSVRCEDDRGFGHLGALEALVRRAASEGADFVGLSPLHALTNRPEAFCPYTPVSRLFRDPLYLVPERFPEWETCPEARLAAGTPALRRRAAALHGADRLEPAAAEALLFDVLRPLHEAFLRGKGAAGRARRREFAAFRRAGGEALERFATFCALADRCEARGQGRDWRGWPAGLHDPDGREVAEFRARHAQEISFHAFLQFELDRQLGALAASARAAGLALGLYADLALGSAAGGSDTWSFPDRFARGVRVGAPPDGFSRAGQDWGFPPLDPRALRADGYRHFAALLDANLRHAGALRIDHALGLRRLFWIPDGASPREGAYVRYPEADLLRELARASRRNDAVVIAEDLGTVPEGFAEAIQARGLLSSRVLLFERDAAGFRPASAWPEACLATANTHDLPPLAALLGDDDLRLRRSAGQIPDEEAFAALSAERAAERDALRERLASDGFLAPPEASDPTAFAAAVTAFLCATPARLVGLSLDDLAGEREPINLPGVPAGKHPSWIRRMRIPVEALFGEPHARRILAAVPAERRAPRNGLSADAPAG